MQIDGYAWHCKLYRWWYRNKYRDIPERSNLCPYVRAVIFWAPIRAIFGTWIKLWRVPLNVVTIPGLLYALPKLVGYVSYDTKMVILTLYIILACGAAFIFALLGVIYLLAEDGADITKLPRRAIINSGFPSLVSEYLRSAHDRVCPEVDWSGR